MTFSKQKFSYICLGEQELYSENKKQPTFCSILINITAKNEVKYELSLLASYYSD